MSDLKDRVGVITGGNANLIPNAGDLITGDGNQTVYLRGDGVADGLVLTRDSTAEEGMSWQPGGGGGGGLTNVTGADGITVTTPGLGIREVHNSLVLGTAVAGMDAHVTGTGDAIITTLDGNISISAVGDAVNNGDVTVAADDATGTAELTGGTATIIGANAVTISGSGSAPITLTTGGTGDINVNSSHDEIHTVGRNFNVVAAGSSGISLIADQSPAGPSGNMFIQSVHGNITVRTDDDGFIRIINGSNAGKGIFILANGNVPGVSDIVIKQAVAGAVNIESVQGQINIVSDGDFAVANADINITQAGAGDINFSTASGSQISTIGGSIEMTAVGDEIKFVSSVRVSIQPTGNAFRIFGGTGAGQHAAIADATGGAVQDAECRTALNALLAAMRDTGWGFIAT